jgi:hypothetical protein
MRGTDGQTTYIMNAGLVPLAARTPALAAAAGACASYRFFEFFTAQIRNPNTRRAYARAAVEFWMPFYLGITRRGGQAMPASRWNGTPRDQLWRFRWPSR